MDTIGATMLKAVVGAAMALASWTTTLLAGYGVWVRLLTGGTTIGPSTQWGSVPEANYTGYAPQKITAFSAAALDPAGFVYCNGGLQSFQPTGSAVGSIVTNSVLVTQIPGSTQATGTVTTTAGVVSAPVITLAGAGYLVAPNVTVLGGGTGAVITATISGGVVTALTLVSGGTGYAAATIVIEPPLEIVAFNNFAVPVPLTNPLQAAPIVSQLQMAA